MTDAETTRLINNFFRVGTNDSYRWQDVETLKAFIDYSKDQKNTEYKKFKVALVCICLNQNYWPFLKQMLDGSRKFFLPGHDVDILCWSDITPEKVGEYFRLRLTNGQELIIGQDEIPVLQESLDKKTPLRFRNGDFDPNLFHSLVEDKSIAKGIRTATRDTIHIDAEAVEWPLPTLFRYHLFLQQEEKLKEYDYVFYCDVDMIFVNYVGEEILGEGLTAAIHPMYALRRELYPPFEPNPESKAHIRFYRDYYAGGFQGGRTEDFIKAMKAVKKTIDSDFSKNYIARWNDESHWNRYLLDNPPAVILHPGYIYPDSLIEEYYKKVWGRDYTPHLVTITKKFTTSKEGGEAVRKQLQTM